MDPDRYANHPAGPPVGYIDEGTPIWVMQWVFGFGEGPLRQVLAGRGIPFGLWEAERWEAEGLPAGWWRCCPSDPEWAALGDLPVATLESYAAAPETFPDESGPLECAIPMGVRTMVGASVAEMRAMPVDGMKTFLTWVHIRRVDAGLLAEEAAP